MLLNTVLNLEGVLYFPLTHNSHASCEHQGHPDGEAYEVVAHQVTESAYALLARPPDDTARHALWRAQTHKRP